MTHPNIVEFFAVGRGPFEEQNESIPLDVLFIAMEYAQEGELFEYILKSGRFSEPTARFYFKQLVSAVQYIHQVVGVCHRDLKPENILLDKMFNIKIGDWGFASSMEAADLSFMGTLGFMTPEQLANKSYDPRKSDMFALGVILFMMVTQF